VDRRTKGHLNPQTTSDLITSSGALTTRGLASPKRYRILGTPPHAEPGEVGDLRGVPLTQRRHANAPEGRWGGRMSWLIRKPGGTYWFRRRVRAKLRDLAGKRPRLSTSAARRHPAGKSAGTQRSVEETGREAGMAQGRYVSAMYVPRTSRDLHRAAEGPLRLSAVPPIPWKVRNNCIYRMDERIRTS
jgi:hypothetical protein